MQINIKERVDVNQDGPSLIIEASPPPPPRPPNSQRCFPHMKNVLSIVISRGAEGPGREILQRRLSVRPSRLVFAL